MAKKNGKTNSKYRDSSSKIIFEDPVLCAQFLRGYINIPLLKDVQPEDIEDVTSRYVHLFTEERNSDVVKRVHITGQGNASEKEMQFYLISLIEHKSNVDYNVVMQVFRYIVFIWEDYEKEMERQQPGISKTKAFRYPPVLPIVFYDGVENWSAAVRLHERVLFSDVLGEYIPDYQCILMQVKEYSNAELMKREDVLSVLMMLTNMHRVSDFTRIGSEVSEEYLQKVLKDAPEYLLSIVVQVTKALLSEINVSDAEIDEFTEQIKERNMGRLFANFEAYDVQEARRVAKEEGYREGKEQGLEEGREQGLKEGRKKGIEQGIEQGIEKGIEQGIQNLIRNNRKHHLSRDETVSDIMEFYNLSNEEAHKAVGLYW